MARKNQIKAFDSWDDLEYVKSAYLELDGDNLFEPYVDVTRWWVREHSRRESYALNES